MTTTNGTATIIDAVVESFIAQAKGTIAQEALDIGVTEALKIAFTACKTQAEFLGVFGSGGNSKLPEYIQGEIDTAFRAALGNITLPRNPNRTKEETARLVAAVQKKALAHFKSEMSNCRRVKALGLTLNDKGARAVLNEYNKKATAAAAAAAKRGTPETSKIPETPETPETTDTMPRTPEGTDWLLLGKTASMEDIANLVSSFVAHHGTVATRALAAQLRDFMPITVTKSRQIS